MSISRGSEWRQWDLHVHTASSYDTKYRGEDANELLVQAWRENNISAVAITDHFLIDGDRLNRLKELAGDDVVIFPGVELRTDKGSTNLHVISIFPETRDYKELENSFNAIMINLYAKAKDNLETIYWDFKRIVDFTTQHNGLLSIHAGNKDQGVDDTIKNDSLFKMALKIEISTVVHIYEVSKKKDIEDYKKKVLPHIGPKPLVICSDNHDPRDYNRKERLWIKADTTFGGLIQVINHPDERVFVGDIPDKIDIANKRKSVYIDIIHVKKRHDARNTESNWFNYDIPLNNGLSVVIGNKGSGKSAFADIIGHLCDCNSINEASFLNIDRFRKPPERYSDDYLGAIQWLDGKKSREVSLTNHSQVATTQYAQYLPQKFIERICTDLGKQFQQEINKVIFSYVDSTEKGDAKSLDELIYNKSHPFFAKINTIKDELGKINNNIIFYENKLTSNHKQIITDNLRKYKDLLERHIKNKPTEIIKPESTLGDKDNKRLEECETKIIEIESNIQNYKSELTSINTDIDALQNIKSDIDSFESLTEQINARLIDIKNKYFKDDDNFTIKYKTPKEKIEQKIRSFKARKEELKLKVDDSKNAKPSSLYQILANELMVKKSIIEKADAKEKAYQKYLEDLKSWELTKEKLIGSATIDESLEYYKSELNKILNSYPSEYEKLKSKRKELIRDLFYEKLNISGVYSQVYKPIESVFTSLLSNMDDKVEFCVNIVNSDNDIASKILAFVNHSFAGIFSGRDNAFTKLNHYIRETVFSDIDSVLDFIDKILEVVYEDIDKSSSKVKDKFGLYNLVTGLDYLGIEFNLNYAGRELLELSPGERGIVLLIFYLALNKGEEPLIIDQPEDNLDNESVFNKLVPCIKEAKKRRQVIIVTHNPNIAIACDAEQIVHCRIDKSKNEITYIAGSIENEEIRKRIIDVLEGTEPAFTLRRKKYLF